MADKINAIKIKQPNGSYSDQIPISVLVQNVQWDQNHNLLDALGSVDLSSSGKGNLQHQIDELDEDKISHDDFNSRLDDFLSQQISADTESWLEENVNAGQTIGLTTNLTISGLAADAKAVGDAIDAKTFPIDNTLSDSSTNPVQNKVVTSAIDELNESLETIAANAFSNNAKMALIDCLVHMAWTDDGGQEYLSTLISKLKIYPVSISVTYTQAHTVYENSNFNILKLDLKVNATYSNGFVRELSDTEYTLSGTLAVGTSTMTVACGNATSTFTVTVTEPIPMLYEWDFTKSLKDTVRGVTVNSASGRAPTRDSRGLVFSSALQQISVTQIDMTGKTIELDIASANFKGNRNYHSRIVMLNNGISQSNGLGLLLWNSGGYIGAYGPNAATGASYTWSNPYMEDSAENIYALFSGKTLKLVCDADGHTIKLYVNNVLKGTTTTVYFSNSNMRYLHIGGLRSQQQSNGNQMYDMIITGMRIYENPVE